MGRTSGFDSDDAGSSPAAVLSVPMPGDKPAGEVEVRLVLDPALCRGVEMLIRPEKGEPMGDEAKAALRDRFAGAES